MRSFGVSKYTNMLRFESSESKDSSMDLLATLARTKYATNNSYDKEERERIHAVNDIPDSFGSYDVDAYESFPANTYGEISAKSMDSILRDIVDETINQDIAQEGLPVEISAEEERKTWSVVHRNPPGRSDKREECRHQDMDSAFNSQVYSIGSVEKFKMKSKTTSTAKDMPTKVDLCDIHLTQNKFTLKYIFESMTRRKRRKIVGYKDNSFCGWPSVIKLKD